MIDNPRTTAQLLEQMQGHLPIPAFPTSETVRILRRGGVKARADRALSVKRVFYAGDEGGIVCDVTPSQVPKRSLSSPSRTCASLRTIPSSAPFLLTRLSESDASQRPGRNRPTAGQVSPAPHYFERLELNLESRVLKLIKRTT